jgi:hypothetical protein
MSPFRNAFASELAAGFNDALDQTAGGREERDEAGLQGVVDVALAGEERVRRTRSSVSSSCQPPFSWSMKLRSITFQILR